MGIFDKIFGRVTKVINAKTYFKMLNGYTPVFHSWNGSIYESELVRAAIEARARHVSKLSVTLQGAAKPSLQTKLRLAPNEFQTWGQFLARTSTILDVRNTAFIVPVIDQFGDTTGVYTIAPKAWELVEVSGEPWIRFKFDREQNKAIELYRVGILTKYQYTSDLFGESNAALKETMDLIKIQRQGIMESAKNSASYRFMARLDNFADPDDLRKERERFDNENFQRDGGGLLLFPNKYSDIRQLNQQSYAVDAEQMKLIQTNINNYFGVNDDILQNKAIGDAWSAFYEGAVEPFAIQISDVMTKMLFTLNERSRGSSIFLSANRLQYMSNADKLNVSASMADRGLMTINEIREIWNLPPVEGGDVRIMRGEYYDATTSPKEGDTNASEE